MAALRLFQHQPEPCGAHRVALWVADAAFSPLLHLVRARRAQAGNGSVRALGEAHRNGAGAARVFRRPGTERDRCAQRWLAGLPRGERRRDPGYFSKSAGGEYGALSAAATSGCVILPRATFRPLRKCSSSASALFQPLLASARTKGNVALFSA